MIATLTSYSQNISKQNHAYLILLIAWACSLVMLPIIRWVAGDGAITWGILPGVLLQAAAVAVTLKLNWSVQRIAATFATIAALTWAAEFIGSTTGFPFGSYAYTDRLQPQIAGVPLLIPFAWFMMLPPAWAISRMIAGNRQWAFIGVSALAMTAWDLFLDPQMVGWGFWVWAQPEGYFGIPWVNYLGWLLVSAGVTAIIRPKRLPVVPLIVIYGLVWGLQSIGQIVFWGLPGPGIVGFLAMGSLLMLAARQYRQQVLPAKKPAYARPMQEQQTA